MPATREADRPNAPLRAGLPFGMKRQLKWLVRVALAIVLIAGVGIMVGCVRNSGGVWYFKEAKLPAGWPDLTPVGEIQVKQYPPYREAVVTDEQAAAEQGAMFNVLFEHIKANDIAMTAPVDLTYERTGQADEPKMRSMAFLYDVPDRGPTGEQGPVTVRDVPAMRAVSIGVRGRYDEATFERNIDKLRRWLADQSAYAASGPPRLLGYNSPFVPFFWRYGEVQIPIAPTTRN